MKVRATWVEGIRRMVGRKLWVLMGAAGALVAAEPSQAIMLDLSGSAGWTEESSNGQSTFNAPAWGVVPTINGTNYAPNTAVNSPGNSYASFWKGPSSLTVLNKKFSGYIIPGSDDDYLGIGIGLPSGNPFIQPNAEYLLLQWKGADQTFNFSDIAANAGTFNDLTPGGFAPAGLSLSLVEGTPTADELWARNDQVTNPEFGKVTELARGTTLGFTPYDRQGGEHFVEVLLTSTNVKIWVDGSLEFDVNGSFPNGTFGFYEGWQSGGTEEGFHTWSIVPEPASITLLGLGGLMMLRRCRNV